MDAISYFFFNSGILLLVLALVFFLLGLLLGWIIWAKFKKLFSGGKQLLDKCEAETNTLTQNNLSLQRRLSRAQYKESQHNEQLSKLHTENSQMLSELAKLKQQGKIDSDNCHECEQQLKTAKESLNELNRENSKLAKELESLQQAAAKENVLAAADKKAPDAVNLMSGVTRDEKLGFIYDEKPATADDLTKIKGIATVLNKKLNDFGVYTYRQIALWNDAIIEEFATRLSFKNRVKQDDWVNQAKELHKAKYREPI